MRGRKRSDSTAHARPLWAPWRIQYIAAPTKGGCFLCEKAKGEPVANHVIARGQHAFVLLNTFPYNSGHVLVAPYRHTADLSLLNPDELAEVMGLILRAKDVMTQTMHPHGFNIGFNLGAPAGAGVADHVHGHVVPRWIGDTNFMPVLGDTRVVPQALEDTAGLLRDAWHR
jgi:ATP adenylyltransferase